MSKQLKNTISIVCLTFFSVLFTIMTSVISASGYSLRFGEVVLLSTHIAGVLTNIRLILLVALVLVGKKTGTIISYSIIFVSTVPMFAQMIFLKTWDSIPGVANTISGAVLIYVTYSFINNINQYNKILQMLSQQDPLTGMHNLTAVREHIDKAIKSGKEFYVSFLYIENFAALNDMMGRDFGNSVLKALSSRFIGSTIEGEYGGKNGDSEFVLVIDASVKGQKDPEVEKNEVEARVRQFIKQVKRPLIIDNTEIALEPRAAVVKFPEDGNSINELYRHLDDTITHYKNQSNMEVAFYDASVTNELTENGKIEDRLFKALSTDEIHLVYQPQFDLNTGKLRGFETLSRLEDEEGKNIRPDRFIAVAEKSNLIFRVDNWVLIHAIRDFKDVVKNSPELIVSVNISANHLQKPGYAEFVLRTLKENDFPNQNLEIEITETVFATAIGNVKTTMDKLRKNGVKVALDDFGTGYASLSYLSQLPVNLLKIDKSFVDKMYNSDVDKEFIELIISMGHVLHAEVIAEGVEEEKQMASLKEWGCDMVQGYYTGRPMDFEKALEVISKDKGSD